MRRDLVLALIVPILSVVIAVAIIVAIGETLLFVREMTHDRWPPVFVGTAIMIVFTLLAWFLARRPSTAR
jgi:flagellar biosynthesis protein FliQ